MAVSSFRVFCSLLACLSLAGARWCGEAAAGASPVRRPQHTASAATGVRARLAQAIAYGGAPGETFEVVETCAYVSITTKPPGARIYVYEEGVPRDEEQVPRLTPCNIEFDLGNKSKRKYEINVVLEGHRTVGRRYTLERGAKHQLDLPLERQADPRSRAGEPSVEILELLDGAAVSNPLVTVKARVLNPDASKVVGVTLFVNDRRDRAYAMAPSTAGAPAGRAEWVQRVTLQPGTNTISAVVIGEDGVEGPPRGIRLVYKPPAARLIKPVLYLLAIGVKKYKQPSYGLKFPDKDVSDFVNACRLQKGKIFRDVVIKPLLNEKATKDEILDGLDWLSKQATDQDWAMVFLAGHGVPDHLNQYYFLPYGGEQDRLKVTGVLWSEFMTTLTHLPGKRFLIVDTCHAAGASGTATRGPDAYAEILRDAPLDEAGLILMASCLPKQVSQEKDEWKNGAFTKALVEALRTPQADADKDHVVSLAETDAYISRRVKALTGGTQHPTVKRPETIRSALPLAALR